MSIEREKRIWYGMKQRCYNPNCLSYKWYGKRGITICDRWLESYENFYEDMGPSNGLSIERINNDGNYEPENCKWATKYEQEHNKRKSPMRWSLDKYPNLGNKSAYTYR